MSQIPFASVAPQNHESCVLLHVKRLPLSFCQNAGSNQSY